jgi:hypothetical protein
MVFSFFINKGWENHRLNRFHINLLKRYIGGFDEVIFCIIIDDINDHETILSFETAIINLGVKNIQFKIYENTNFRESLVYKKEIVDKMSKLDGCTFFGHNKGISYIEQTEDMYKWVAALYYFNLEVGLINYNMNGDCFYGGLKCYNIRLEDYDENAAGVLPKYNWFYCGTFFWGKYQEIYYLLKNMGREIPPMMSRWFDEMFPGNILESKWGTSYGNVGADSAIIYSNGENIDNYLHFLYKDDTWVCDDFYSFYNEVISEI